MAQGLYKFEDLSSEPRTHKGVHSDVGEETGDHQGLLAAFADINGHARLCFIHQESEDTKH